MLEREADLCRESASEISRLPWKEELQDKIGQIELVDEVARIMTTTLDIDEVYECFAQELKKLVDFDRANINLVDLQMSQSILKYLYGETLPNLPLGSSVELQGSQIAEVIATGKTIIRKDLTADAAFHNDKGFLELGLRSNIMSPLLSRNRVIGTISLRSHQVGAYGLREQVVLERLANQIAPAVENAELYQQLRASIEEQAVVDEVARIVTSTLDIDKVYEKFFEELKKLVGFERAIISMIDHQAASYTIKYTYGWDAAGLRIGQTRPLSGSPIQEVMESGETINRQNVADAPRFFVDEEALEAGLYSNIRTPLISKGRVVGALSLRNGPAESYGPREQAILERLASQIAPAVENAILFEQVQAGIEEKAVVDEVARIITSTLDIDQVFNEFAEEMKKLVDFDRMAFNIIDEERKAFESRHVFGPIKSGTPPNRFFSLEGTQTQQVLATGEMLNRDNIQDTPHFMEDQKHLDAGLTSSILVPLIFNGQIIATMGLRSKSIAAFGDHSQQILKLLAVQIAPAVANAKLYRLATDAERELSKLSRAVEQSSSGVMITDSQGKIEYVNPKFSETTGYSLDEVIGENPRFLKSDHTPPEDYRELWETIGSGQEWHGEFLNRRKNGELYWAAESISPIRSPEGKITHYVAVEEDVNERKQLRERLLQAQKMDGIGQLAGGVAHDFNNILSVITGYTSMLLSKNLTEAAGAAQLKEIGQAAERGSQLTNQLLGFSRRQVAKPITLDVGAAIKDTFSMLRRVIGEDIDLVILPEEESPAVFIDPTQLDQIVMNLVVNARDAMPEGGAITVTVRRSHGGLDLAHSSTGDFVLLSVSDTGMGMSEEVKAHLFEPFFTTKERGKGTGLGLATCYGIVEQNGGHIEVESEFGNGSTFKVYLPVTEELNGSGIDDEGSVAAVSTPGTETILLVEDEPQVRAMEATILADQGYAVLQAADGEEALRVCQASQNLEIQLLVTDMVMPRMSGGELITELSSSRPETKFLVVSGYSEDTLEGSVLARDDVHFMQKPFKPMELAHAVRQILDGVPEPLG